MWYILLPLISSISSAPLQSPFLVGNNAFLTKEYVNAITAYGPGLGVFTPYSYVDLSYDNIPFVGKIPVLGKEGTSSKLGISPFSSPPKNPGNPFPPIYRAHPLPLHVPEPQDVVAVPLDEEALHGEPLFPRELTLPWQPKQEVNEEETEKPTDPFGINEFDNEKDLVKWPAKQDTPFDSNSKDNRTDVEEVTTRVDKVTEKNVKEDMVAIGPLMQGRLGNNFRTKRVRRAALLKLMKWVSSGT